MNLHNLHDTRPTPDAAQDAPPIADPTVTLPSGRAEQGSLFA